MELPIHLLTTARNCSFIELIRNSLFLSDKYNPTRTWNVKSFNTFIKDASREFTVNTVYHESASESICLNIPTSRDITGSTKRVISKQQCRSGQHHSRYNCNPISQSFLMHTL